MYYMEEGLEEYDNVTESAIFGASLTPPALPLFNGPPSWVLLDRRLRLHSRRRRRCRRHHRVQDQGRPCHRARRRHRPPVPVHPAGHVRLLLCCSMNSYSYIIAFLKGTRGMAYELHRFHFETNTWTMNKLELGATAMNPAALNSAFFCTSKVFTLGGGGGFVGWADLWRDVLLCDVLLDDPELRYIPLPHAFGERKWDAVITRDIAVVDQGCIKYVDKRSDEHSADGWTLTAWSKKIVSRQPWKEEQWRQDCELRSSDVSVLLPPLPRPFHELMTGHPVISLRGDDVVYLMSKESLRDDTAWVVAVDME